MMEWCGRYGVPPAYVGNINIMIDKVFDGLMTSVKWTMAKELLAAIERRGHTTAVIVPKQAPEEEKTCQPASEHMAAPRGAPLPAVVQETKRPERPPALEVAADPWHERWAAEAVDADVCDFADACVDRVGSPASSGGIPDIWPDGAEEITDGVDNVDMDE